MLKFFFKKYFKNFEKVIFFDLSSTQKKIYKSPYNDEKPYIELSINNSLIRYFKNNNILNEKEYIDLNDDIASSKADPVAHYIKHGQKENRRLSIIEKNEPNAHKLIGSKIVLSEKIFDCFVNMSSSDYSNYISSNKLSSEDKKDKKDKSTSLIKNDENPLISVITCTYNAENLITDTLESLAIQSYKNFEVIVIDDCSEDKTCEIINKFIAKNKKKIKIKLIKKNKNKGLVDSIKVGLQDCKYPYITFLEQDDIFCKDNLLHKANTLNTYPSAKIISGFVVPFGEVEEVIKVQNYLAETRIRLNSHVNHIHREEIVKINYIPTFSGTLISKKLLNNIQLTDLDHQKLDWFLWANVLCEHPLHISPESKVYWRKHSDSLSLKPGKHLATRNSFFQRIHGILDLEYISRDTDTKLISSSELFNETWYSKKYSVPKKESAAHYLYEGWLEGNDPSENFSTNDYILFHPDIRKANKNPLLHFLLHGQNSKRLFAKAKYKEEQKYVVWLTTAPIGGAVHEYRLNRIAERISIKEDYLYFDSATNPQKNILNYINNASVVIINRPLMSGICSQIIHYAKEKGCELIADFDDAVTSEMFYCNGRYLSYGPKDIVIKDGQMQEGALLDFKYLTVSSDYLKTYYHDAFKEKVFLLRNKIFSGKINLDIDHIEEQGAPIKIAIFSGSITHDHDIETIILELISLKYFYNFELYFVGKSNVIDNYKNIIKLPFVKYEDSIKQMRYFDIILAPLAFNDFNTAKSNIRFLETAKAGKVIFAPNIGEFKSSVTDGVDGFLYNEGKFLDKFIKITKPHIHDGKLDIISFRKQLSAVAQASQKTVEEKYTTSTNSDDDLDFKYLINKLLIKKEVD
jgi:glycosyltransferase involved in cell wall biosynthesis